MQQTDLDSLPGRPELRHPPVPQHPAAHPSPRKAAGSRCQPPKAEGTGRAAAVGHQILLYAPEAELPAPLVSPPGTSEHPRGCVPALELREGDTRTLFSSCPSKSECQMTGGQTSQDPLPLPPSPPGPLPASRTEGLSLEQPSFGDLVPEPPQHFAVKHLHCRGTGRGWGVGCKPNGPLYPFLGAAQHLALPHCLSRCFDPPGLNPASPRGGGGCQHPPPHPHYVPVPH